MSSKDRIQIFPSRANAVLMKQRVTSAKRGMSLLKHKRDAIDQKLREIKNQMAKKEDVVDASMRKAIFSVTKANLLGTDFKPVIVADSRVATTRLLKRQQKLIGVTLNYYELEMQETGAFPLVGLSCGGQQVLKVRKCFKDALQNIVEYASMEYMKRMMVKVLRQTNMRVNALEYVVVPRLVNTFNYINGEMEEFEREDFYRLKRSQAKQREAKQAFTELIKTKDMTMDELKTYQRFRGSTQFPDNTPINLQDMKTETLDDILRFRRSRNVGPSGHFTRVGEIYAESNAKLRDLRYEAIFAQPDLNKTISTTSLQWKYDSSSTSSSSDEN